MLCGPAPVLAAPDGLPVGPLVLKPSLTVDAVYDSNVYRQQTSPQADFGLQAVPRFALEYPGENFGFTLDAYYRFFSYFDVGDNPSHSDLQVVNQFGIGTSFDINRKGKFGVNFAPEFNNRPASRGIGDSTDLELAVGVPVQLTIRPTKSFEIGVDGGWRWTKSYYPTKAFDPDPIVLGNRHEVQGGLSVDWRFFPRSHVVFDGQAGRVLWGEISEGEALNDRQQPATFFDLRLGLVGDISRKLSFLAKIGYGNVLFDAGFEDKNLTGAAGLLGEAEFAMRPVLTQRIAIGFSRSFNFQYYADKIVDTQAYFRYAGLFFQRMQVTGEFSWIYREMTGFVARTEHQWTAGAGIDVTILNWLRAGVAYAFGTVNPSSSNEGEFVDNRVTLGVTLGFR